MTQTFALRPHFELRQFIVAAFFSRIRIDFIERWAFNRLTRLFDNGILATIGFRQTLELHYTPEDARNEIASFGTIAKRFHTVTTQLMDSNLSPNLLRLFQQFDAELQKAQLTLQAVSLLDAGAEVIFEHPFAVQDEVMRIASLRTPPDYWEEPERKLWLEAELS
jgi:hypothetical protein